MVRAVENVEKIAVENVTRRILLVVHVVENMKEHYLWFT